MDRVENKDIVIFIIFSLNGGTEKFTKSDIINVKEYFKVPLNS